MRIQDASRKDETELIELCNESIELCNESIELCNELIELCEENWREKTSGDETEEIVKPFRRIGNLAPKFVFVFDPTAKFINYQHKPYTLYNISNYDALSR